MSPGSRRSWFAKAVNGGEARPAKRRHRLQLERLEVRNVLSLAVPQLAVADDSGALGDYITNVNQPHLVGGATPGDTIKIASFGGSKSFGQSTVGGDGAFSVQFGSPVADGTSTFKVIEQDPSGNFVDQSQAFTLQIKSTPPASPYQPLLMPSDVAGAPNTTSKTRPTFYGQTEAHGLVDLLDAQGNLLASTTASILDGTFTIQPTNDLPAGVDELRFRVHDRAGNWGAPGASADITVLASTPPVTVPTDPTIPTYPTTPPSVPNPPVTWVGTQPVVPVTSPKTTLVTSPSSNPSQAVTQTATNSVTHATTHTLAHKSVKHPVMHPMKHPAKHPIAVLAKHPKHH